jgi:hypothetical protein
MNKRITSALLLLLGALGLHALAWWLKLRDLGAGATGLILASGLLVIIFGVALLRRIANSSGRAPMN